MRGQRPSQGGFASLIKFETLIPAEHPIQTIERICDEVLGILSSHSDEN